MEDVTDNFSGAGASATGESRNALPDWNTWWKERIAVETARKQRDKAMQPYHKRMAQAEKMGEICGHCGKMLEPAEAVTLCSWRREIAACWSGHAPVCADCMALPYEQKLIAFHIAGARRLKLIQMHCEGCGRPVSQHMDSRRKRVYCSQRCYWRLVKPAVEHDPRPCAMCGENFMPTREDAEYCSGKCRQKAYRKRQSNLK